MKTKVFVPQPSKERRQSEVIVPQLSKEQRRSEVFVPQLSKEQRRSEVFVPQLSKERRRSEVFCLGSDQGCGAGACAIAKEVPKDTICQECANYTNRTGTPLNILCCGLVFHKKSVVKDAMEIMERWIPDFKASAIG
jgi:hypothetical protein